jgi:uncharacterized protein (DUF305 family)
MKGNERVLLWSIIAFILGIIFTTVFASSAVNNNNMGMMRMMGMRSNQMMDHRDDKDSHNDSDRSMMMQMDDMTASLKGKKGDAFDETFLSEMIVHHQGAIDMAELAKENANHQEIKDLAEEIISAQTNEIEMMKNWQDKWDTNLCSLMHVIFLQLDILQMILSLSRT